MKLQNLTARQSLCLCGERIAFAVLLLFFLLLPSLGSAQTRIEVTPMIDVSETYDDNIFLTKDNKVSDYITVVTPGISMGLVQEHTNFQVRYAPSFYRYADRDDQDNTAHSAGLTFGQDLVEGLRFNLTDTFLKSDRSSGRPPEPAGDQADQK